jgi:hypothetical protein
LVNTDENLIDPSQSHPQLHNKDWVWFDPAFGWITDVGNVNDPSFLDQAAPALLVIGVNLLTSGVGSVFVNAIGAGVTQFVVNGHINFNDLLQSALSAGLTAEVLDGTGLGGTGGSIGDVLGHMTGRAGVQGVIKELTGGKFSDGALQGLVDQ